MLLDQTQSRRTHKQTEQLASSQPVARAHDGVAYLKSACIISTFSYEIGPWWHYFIGCDRDQTLTLFLGGLSFSKWPARPAAFNIQNEQPTFRYCVKCVLCILAVIRVLWTNGWELRVRSNTLRSQFSFCLKVSRLHYEYVFEGWVFSLFGLFCVPALHILALLLVY